MRKLRIQIVDDDHDLADSLAEFVELNGHQTARAYDAIEALAQFRDSRFDLVFMDIKMPGIDGVEALEQMKAIRPHADVIMMTGYSVQDRIDTALSFGACDVLHKPLNLETVKALLHRFGDRRLVLVIDDDQDYVESVCDLLEHQGHIVSTANSGEAGLRRIVENGINVVVLDLRMENMGGIEVIKSLNQLELKLPIVVVTAYAHEEQNALAAVRTPALTAVLSKPVDPDEFLNVVQSAGVGPI